MRVWTGWAAGVVAGALGGLAGAQEKPVEPTRPVSVEVQHQEAEAATTPESRPLPDIPTLMHEAEAHEKASEAIMKQYLYTQDVAQVYQDGKGATRKTENREYDVFYLNGVEVTRLVKKDGRELTDDEKKKESERLEKEVARAKSRREKAENKGKDTDSGGNETISVSRFLELGAFTNARRVRLTGRDTIAVDFAGDPQAKTRSRGEAAVRDMVGTVWVDETDRALVRAEGRFVNPFKIGGGLLVNISQGTGFAMQMTKVNGEVWLPERVDAHGDARALLFFDFKGSVAVRDSNYRKFKASATLLPGASKVGDAEREEASPK